MYRLFVPTQAAGANAVHFDLFNASGSGLYLEIFQVLPIVSGAVAVVGTLGVDLYLTRTTDVGTGGTAATYEGTSLSAATFSHMDGSQPLNPSVSARRTPTGGATAGAVITFRSIFTEETNSATYAQTGDMVRNGNIDQPGLIVAQGTGIRVVQGSVASVGNIGYEVLFKTVSRG